MKLNIKKYYSIGKTQVLFFILGILAGFLFYFYSENSYENKLFESLAINIQKQSESYPETEKDSIQILKSLEFIHNTIHGREQVFHNIGGIKAGIIQPLTVDLMTGQGDCGSYALVFARLLVELKKEVRMVQMKVNGVYGGHIVVETKIDNSWVVLDPYYNLYFKTSAGNLASFSDVRKNWQYFQQQLPGNYNQSYKYEDMVYTNWNKIPVIMPLVKNILDLTLGKKNADSISLRILALRKFQILFYVTLFFAFTIILNFFWTLIKLRKKQQISRFSNLSNNRQKNGKVKLILPDVKNK